MTVPASPDSLPNAYRIASARAALSAAMWARGLDVLVGNEAVVDLLADLRHFCIARHIDFATCNGLAESRFESEISGGQR